MEFIDYLLFRFYLFYEKREKSNHIFSASAVLATLVSLNLITIYLVLSYFDIINHTFEVFTVSVIVMLIMITIFLYAKTRKFLDRDLSNFKNGNAKIFCYFCLTLISVIIVAKLNRDKILGA